MSGVRSRWVEVLAEGGWPGWLIPNYWSMLTLAIIVGSGLTLWLWRRFESGSGQAADLLFWGIPSLLVGSKLVYFLQYGVPSDFSQFWHTGGFALYGGLAGLLAAWGVYYVVRPYPVTAFLDAVTPGLAVGLFLGRIGCFLAGCNGGVPAELPWSVRFPRDTPVYLRQLRQDLVGAEVPLSLPVHPTQLYEALFGLLAAVFLLRLLRQRQWRGQVFFSGMLWYAVFRFCSEWLRSDAGGWHPFGLTFAQVLSVLLGSVTVCALARGERRSRTVR